MTMQRHRDARAWLADIRTPGLSNLQRIALLRSAEGHVEALLELCNELACCFTPSWGLPQVAAPSWPPPHVIPEIAPTPGRLCVVTPPGSFEIVEEDFVRTEDVQGLLSASGGTDLGTTLAPTIDLGPTVMLEDVVESMDPDDDLYALNDAFSVEKSIPVPSVNFDQDDVPLIAVI